MMRDPERTIGARTVGKRNIRAEELLRFEDQVVSDGNFSDRKLLSLAAMGCRFERCLFERLRVEDAKFGLGAIQTVYRDCSFDGSLIRAPSPGNARFERCSFRDVRLRDWIAFEIELVDCIFTGRADKCIFNGTVLENRQQRAGRHVNQYSGNDFSNMELYDVAFRTGVDLDKQKLPTGPRYVHVVNAESAIAHTRAAVSEWQDESEMMDALAILRWLEKETRGGQDQLFLQENDSRDVTMTKVFELLRARAEKQ